jgi:cysteine desulfurase
MALKGVLQALKRRGHHVVSTSIEHLSISHPLKSLEKDGFEVTYLPVDHEGRVNPDQVAQVIRPDTLLVSVMHANNEIGTIEPIEEISAITHERGVYLHTDATATVGVIPVDVGRLGVNLLSCSAQSLYGPKGVGVLYVKRGTRIRTLLEGGTQEDGRRAGTENVPGIAGIGKAAEIAQAELPLRMERLGRLRNQIKRGLEREIDSLYPTGSWVHRLPHHGSWCVDFVEGSTLLSAMGEKGIAASSGSACSSQALKASTVLRAIGIPEELAKGSLLLSVGLWTTEEEVAYLLDMVPPLVRRLREMSPHYQRLKYVNRVSIQSDVN